MPASTLELTLPAPDGDHERLIAVLQPLGFERFWQEERRLRAYVPSAGWTEAAHERLEGVLRPLGVDGPHTLRPIAEKNWNVVWEKNLAPVTAGPFLITPTWLDAPSEHDPRFVLRIDPEMSFGTGHHESTRLALRLLAGAGEDATSGARVLDAGTGTGVLAMAAVRLGAAHVTAFDTDERVLENARDNLARNDAAAAVSLSAGSFGEVVPEDEHFDLILANIHRGTLAELLPAFRRQLRAGGCAVLSGLFAPDREPMIAHAAACGLVPQQEATENEWWAVRLGADPSE